MITFLVEVDAGGDFAHDFTWSIYKSVNYHLWYHQKNTNYKLVKVKSKNEKEIFTYNIGNQHVVPIGSVEFVHRYMKMKGLDIPNPLNVPEELRKSEFLKRDVFESSLDELDWNRSWFIKPVSDIKKFTGFVAKDLESAKLFEPNIKDDEILFVSDPINIVSEYRCIIHKNELQAIQYYQGEFTIFPNVDMIKKIISDYKDSPPTYTLDLGITEKGETIIVELHHFYSCGLYGFNDWYNLPKMFSDWWYWYCKK